MTLAQIRVDWQASTQMDSFPATRVRQRGLPGDSFTAWVACKQRKTPGHPEAQVDILVLMNSLGLVLPSAAALMQFSTSLGFVYYFGNQRFSSAFLLNGEVADP